MINWDRVTELRTDMGEDGFDEVVELFLSEMEEKLDEMAQSGMPPTPEELHFLRGSSANLGFRELMVLCQSMERGEVESTFAPLKECYERSKSAFLKQQAA